MYINLGNSILLLINSFLNNPRDNEPPNLSLKLEKFIEVIERNSLKTRTVILKTHVDEFKNIFNCSTSSTSKLVSTPVVATPSTNTTIDGYEFKKFTPLVDESSRIKCSVEGCESTFRYKRSYEAHVVTLHPNALIDFTVADAVGTCRMVNKRTGLPCGVKLSLSSMYPHLLNIHNVRRPAKHKLVGFKMGPNPMPVFLPSYSSQVQNLSKETCEEDNISEVEANVEKIVQKSSNQDSTDANYEETEEEPKLISSSNSPLNISNEGNNSQGEAVNIISIKKPESKNRKRKLLIEDAYDGTPILKKRKFNKRVVEKFEKFEKNIKFGKMSRNIPQDNSSTSKQHNPQQFGQKSEDDDDSDFEHGDTIDFSARRMKNKKERQLLRNENVLKPEEMPGNSEFITDMINYMKSENISTKNLDKSTIPKTLNELFYKEDSFMNFHKKKDENFNLNRLRKFNDEDFIALTYPIEWLNSTCKDDGIKGSTISLNSQILNPHDFQFPYLDFEYQTLSTQILNPQEFECS